MKIGTDWHKTYFAAATCPLPQISNALYRKMGRRLALRKIFAPEPDFEMIRCRQARNLLRVPAVAVRRRPPPQGYAVAAALPLCPCAASGLRDETVLNQEPYAARPSKRGKRSPSGRMAGVDGFGNRRQEGACPPLAATSRREGLFAAVQ